MSIYNKVLARVTLTYLFLSFPFSVLTAARCMNANRGHCHPPSRAISFCCFNYSEIFFSGWRAPAIPRSWSEALLLRTNRRRERRDKMHHEREIGGGAKLCRPIRIAAPKFKADVPYYIFPPPLIPLSPIIYCFHLLLLDLKLNLNYFHLL